MKMLTIVYSFCTITDSDIKWSTFCEYLLNVSLARHRFSKIKDISKIRGVCCNFQYKGKHVYRYNGSIKKNKTNTQGGITP